jgi:hypothetical protein
MKQLMLRVWCCCSPRHERRVCGGASAVQKLLDQFADSKPHVLVVWDPILATDWGSPSDSTLRRISDPRVRQFWDPNHLVSLELSRIAKAKTGEPQLDCCEDNGFFWDDAILYAPHTRWKEMPVSVLWNGPVWKIIPDLENAAQKQR